MKERENRQERPGRDAIERELHAIREEYARKFGYDVHEMFNDLRAKQQSSGQKVVSFPPKHIAQDRKKEQHNNAM